ncbi:hypothetical protein Pan216_12920 [Planctomycetes bacterium Pan216]|uniref:Apea-like HEPN domain-containing protein n=2 Tax=Kolteria novifilia TaxID=2527975 RepID=A0A518B0F4_9BACT|nr:hypothetical protein Pan216_12920 [Planctomycetes bacterium Pan216]
MGCESIPIFDFELLATFIHIEHDGESLDGTSTTDLVTGVFPKWINGRSGGNKLQENDPEVLLRLIDEQARDYFRRAPDDYTLLSGISLENYRTPEGTLPSEKINLSGCEIELPNTPRRRFEIPDRLANIGKGPIIQHLTETGYQTLLARVKARSSYDAARKGEETLDLLRAIWTLAGTYTSLAQNIGGKPKPIGVLFLSPVAVTYAGTPGFDSQPSGVYCEFGFTEDRDLYRPGDKWSELERLRELYTSSLNRNPLGPAIENLLRRYVRALDHLDIDTSLFQMWSVLESLASTADEDYSVVIKKSTAIFADASRGWIRDVMSTARANRNAYVHAAEKSSARRYLTRLVKKVVDNHLLRLIENRDGFSSLDEYKEFLGHLCLDDSTLDRRLRLLQLIADYREEDEANTESSKERRGDQTDAS